MKNFGQKWDNGLQNAPDSIMKYVIRKPFLNKHFFPTSISIILEKFGIDPATSSGPIATIISDIMTIAMYFGIGISLLHFLTTNPRMRFKNTVRPKSQKIF